MKYEPHPIAEVFPMMSDAELQRLADDIKENGLDEYGIIYQGKVLDGRNRQAACEIAGVRMDWQDYDTMEPDEAEKFDPVSFVISRNLHRRQLKQSQRAMIAAKMATLENGQRKSAASNDVAQEDAARLLSVSRPSLQRAKFVLEHGSPELIEAVEQCRISVSMAERLCRDEPDLEEQSRLVEEGKQAIKEHITPPDELEEPKQVFTARLSRDDPFAAARTLLKHYDAGTLIQAIRSIESGEYQETDQ